MSPMRPSPSQSPSPSPARAWVVRTALSLCLAAAPGPSAFAEEPGVKSVPPKPEKGEKADKPEKGEKGKFGKFPKPGHRLSDDEMLSLVSGLSPEMHARLAETRDKQPREFRERMDRLAPLLERHQALRRSENPGLADLLWESYALGEECRELARRYHSATDETGRAAAAEKLREKVAEQFDLEQRRQQAELAEMEKRLARMRQQLKEQADRKDRTVGERVQRWIGKPLPPPAQNPAQGQTPPAKD
jgi:hypothetical protein